MTKSNVVNQEFSSLKDKKNASNFLRPFIPPRGMSTKLNELIAENLDERSVTTTATQESTATRSGERQKKPNSLPSSLQGNHQTLLFDTYSTRHNSNISSAKDSKESSEDETTCNGFEEGKLSLIFMTGSKHSSSIKNL